jgi:hypothetical protein
MKRAIVLGGLIAAVAGTQAASAQVTVGWDVAGFSSYDWRGTRLTNKPVLQPDIYLTFPAGAASLTVGGWANIDIGKYDGASDISESGGTSAFNFAEFDPWAEIAFSVGKATITGGATAYIYPNPSTCGCLNSDFNTVEIYGKVGLDAPLSPKLAAWYDVDKVKGLYVEGSVAHGIPLGTATLTLGALAGFNAGQGAKAGENANFVDDGLTHVDLSAAVGFSAGPLSITPAFHFVINNDEATKVTKFTSTGVNQKDTKIWGGVTISWSKAFGGKAEE